MNAALKHIDRLVEQEELEYNLRAVKHSRGTPADVFITHTHPAVAAEFLNESVVDQHTIEPDVDAYETTIDGILRSRDRYDRNRVDAAMARMGDRVFENGYEAYDGDGRDRSAETVDTLKPVAYMTGLPVAGAGAAAAGQPTVGVTAMVGGVLLAPADMARRTLWWQGYNAAADEHAAESFLEEYAAENGEKRITLPYDPNLPEPDISYENNGSGADIEDVIAFIDEHEPDALDARHGEYLED